MDGPNNLYLQKLFDPTSYVVLLTKGRVNPEPKFRVGELLWSIIDDYTQYLLKSSEMSAGI